MVYTKEFLISELHRFVRENSRNPTKIDIQPKNGYPSSGTYEYYFGSWNSALTEIGLEINHFSDRLDGTEVCSYCGKCADEIENFTNWYYDKNKSRYCAKHGQKGLREYVKGQLDINSNTGLGRAGEILVVKTLKIGKEHDCNKLSCHYSIDMYNEEYDRIDVKTSVFVYDYNKWAFDFGAKKEADTYICLGMSSNRKNVEHVWIVPNKGDIRDLQMFTIKNTYRSLSNRSKWEVDSKPYNDMWKSMKLDNCKIMVDKSKEKTEEEKRKHEEFKKHTSKS